MVAPLVVPAIMAGASIAGSLLSKGKKQKIPSQVTDAWDQLIKYGNTGKLGNYQAGADYGGPLGNFDMTGVEQQGKSKLEELLASGNPDMFNAGTGELNKILTTDTYNPYSDTGLYNGFAQSVDRATREGTQGLKRASAFSGNLYSKDLVKRMGDLQEQGQQQKSNRLAELYDAFVQRRLSAAPMAIQAGQAQESMNQGRIASAYQYGGLERTLADNQAKMSYADFLRKQQEQQGQIGALQSVAGGYPSPTYNASPFEGVLSMLGTVGAQGIANYFGGQSGGSKTPMRPGTNVPYSYGNTGTWSA